MQPVQIIPRYKILMNYDIRLEARDAYYRYMLGEFVPAVQEMGIYMYMAWHTAYGNYPIRRVEFVSETLEAIQKAFQSEEWQKLEERLKRYITNYERRVVRYSDTFQI